MLFTNLSTTADSSAVPAKDCVDDTWDRIKHQFRGDMAIDNTDRRSFQPTILSFVKDYPNLCSLAGLACTVSSIYFSIVGLYSAAMIGMIWAVAFDWGDGLLARRIKGRTGYYRSFGAQLDLLIDIVSYGVAPATLLLCYGDLNPYFLLGAFLMLGASAIRLSYFSTFGLSDASKYTGLALDNNSILLAFIFLFEEFFSHDVFSIILYTCCMGFSLLNVSQIKTPKLSGKPLNVYIFGIYTLSITTIYAWQIF